MSVRSILNSRKCFIVISAAAVVACGGLSELLPQSHAQDCVGGGTPYCSKIIPSPCGKGGCVTYKTFVDDYDYDGEPPLCKTGGNNYVKLVAAANWVVCQVANDDDSQCACESMGCMEAMFYGGENCDQATICDGASPLILNADYGLGEGCFE